MTRIAYQKKVITRNDELAAEVRRILAVRGTLAINILGSPGSGKTSLVERTAGWLKERAVAAALSGDQATENDARRIRQAGLPALQITTGNECHLNAERILKVLEAPEISDARVLLIENVGNLICPAAYDLGEAAKVAVLSVPEGDDKPLKYPALFQRSDLLVINKTDLLGSSDFDLARATANARDVAPHLEVLPLSCRTGEGLSSWFQWIESRLDRA
jgi:hydrogenase nickel incorporation protein HypB